MARGYWRKHRFIVNFPDGHREWASSPKQVIRLAVDGCTVDTDLVDRMPLERFKQEYRDELTQFQVYEKNKEMSIMDFTQKPLRTWHHVADGVSELYNFDTMTVEVTPIKDWEYDEKSREIVIRPAGPGVTYPWINDNGHAVIIKPEEDSNDSH